MNRKENKSGLIEPSSFYERLWECRDLEIEHYWHRMVFMTAFLLACFAGYGGLIVAIIGDEKCKIPFLMANGLLFSLSIVGIIVSCLWLMMSKGSKAWYEEYEHLIELFMKNRKKCFQSAVRKYLTLDYSSIDGMEEADLNDFLWSTKAGGYSVSKVGIAVGHLSVVIWSILAAGHYWIVRETASWDAACQLLSARFFTAPRMVGFGILILLAFWLYAKCCLMSGYFARYER